MFMGAFLMGGSFLTSPIRAIFARLFAAEIAATHFNQENSLG
jgi:hypothetical protein